MENYNPYRNTPSQGSTPAPVSSPMPSPQGRSRQMEKAAVALGIISLISCTFFYVALPCGALAIMFGILSKGSQTSYSKDSLTGILLGLAGIGCTIGITLYMLTFALETYGSFDGLMRAASELSGVEYVPFFIE